MRRAAGVLLVVALGGAALTIRAELTPAELRGRQIYRTGESSSGTPIVALVGPEDLELPATSLPCMSCHGRDGRGKEEGGVSPSNLQWDVLTRPYSVATATGRTHPPYTAALLKRAITMGTDPARQRLNPVMPRYRLSLRDADDLIAYLMRIGTDSDPGLTDDTIVLGLQLPSSPDADAMRAVLTSHFDKVNAAGGIFGRRVRFATDEEEPFATLALGANVARIDDDPDAIVFPILATLEEQSLALIGEKKVRIIHDTATAALAARLASHVDAKSPTVLLLTHAAKLPEAQTLLIPAAFTSDAIFSAPAATRIRVALPTTRPARDVALAAAITLTQALERGGRDIDRPTLAELLKPARRHAEKDVTIVRVEGGKLVKD
jgi:hypothetical protein